MVKFMSNYNKAGVQEAEPTGEQARTHLGHRLIRSSIFNLAENEPAQAECAAQGLRMQPVRDISDRAPCLH